jgi:hypothetical protein
LVGFNNRDPRVFGQSVQPSLRDHRRHAAQRVGVDVIDGQAVSPGQGIRGTLGIDAVVEYEDMGGWWSSLAFRCSKGW